MLRYVSGRIVAMIPVLVIVTFLSYTLMMSLPGDPAQMMLGEQVANDNSGYLALRSRMR